MCVTSVPTLPPIKQGGAEGQEETQPHSNTAQTRMISEIFNNGIRLTDPATIASHLNLIFFISAPQKIADEIPPSENPPEVVF